MISVISSQKNDTLILRYIDISRTLFLRNCKLQVRLDRTGKVILYAAASWSFRRHYPESWQWELKCPLSTLLPVEGLTLFYGKVLPLVDISAQVPFNHHLLSQLVRGGAIRVRNVCPGIPERTLFPSLW